MDSGVHAQNYYISFIRYFYKGEGVERYESVTVLSNWHYGEV